MRSKRHTAIFVNFGTFFARIFSPLKRSGQVSEAISGENLMFEQPPIIPATSLRRPSVPRNRPSKIFRIFFLLFWPYRPYTRTYFFGPGTRNMRKCMPNIMLFLVWGLILTYNDQKTCPKASDPPKNDPKIWLFCPFSPLFGQETSLLWQNITWTTIFYLKMRYFTYPIPENSTEMALSDCFSAPHTEVQPCSLLG